MSKAKFDAAKELIQEKKYAEARTLLHSIDHPTAREWEAKLDKLDTPADSFPDTPKAKRRGCSTRTLATIAVLALFVIVVARLMQQAQTFSTALSDAQNNAVLELAADTATPGPSPTITDTLMPTMTSTASQTPMPSATPTPSLTPVPLIWSGGEATVIGPLDIPEGVYRATATTSGFIIVTVTALEGECGEGSGFFLSPGLFNESQGQATNGAESVFTSKGCRALIEVSNTQTPWVLEMVKVG